VTPSEPVAGSAARPPVVAIVGRPNVGKSTLFNVLVRARRAIVDDTPGVTRDRVVAPATHAGRAFLCVDTGGLSSEPARRAGEIAAGVRAQALRAVAEADCVVCVVDGPAGLSPEDRETLRLLRRSGKPLVVAVNKLDTPARDALVADFYAAGVERPIGVSAAHGRGLDVLRDAIVATLPAGPGEAPAAEATRIALVGRPNVGKSSLLNRLLGDERTLVTARPGTTRDAIDTPITAGGRSYVLIDTAGIRRRTHVKDPLEGHGAVRALGTLTRTDLVLVVLDATEGMTEQDARLVGRTRAAGRGCILLANKWDLVPPARRDPDAFRERLVAAHGAFASLPLLCVSAVTGEGLGALWPLVARVEQAYEVRLGTPELNRALADAVSSRPPPSPGGRALRFYYATQTGRRPPAITVFANVPDAVPAAYTRYLGARLAERFRLIGIPLDLRLRARRATERRPSRPRPPRARRAR
jgi:GTP-binding protein